MKAWLQRGSMIRGPDAQAQRPIRAKEERNQPIIVMGWAMEKRTRRAMSRRRKRLDMRAIASCAAFIPVSLEMRSVWSNFW